MLCLIQILTWGIRGYHFCVYTEAVVGRYCAVLAAAAIFLQLHQVRHLVSQPSICCSERWKGYMYIADLAACTASVVLTSGRLSAPLTTSSFVHTVHGWCTPFAGFRSSAAYLLHAVNFQCYLAMKVSEVFSGTSWSVRRLLGEATCLLLLNCVLPILVNIEHEARQRSKFAEKAANGIKPSRA